MPHSMLILVMTMGIGGACGCVEQTMNEMPLPADAQTTRSDASLGVWDADVAADDSTRPTMDATQEQCIRVGPNCEPGPPHNDVVGMVCAHDGTDEEGYCTVDNAGQMICARSEFGGPCPGSGIPTPNPDGGVEPAPTPVVPGDGNLNIEPMDTDDPLSAFFDREINVFGIRLVASSTVPNDKLSHAAHIMAEYLDNDEDGDVDDPPVVAAMRNRRAILVMFDSFNELKNSGIFESSAIEGYWGQDLYADETAQPGRFDASLEEVLHLITTAGYEQVYPEAFGSLPGTLLTDAMDMARGGRFNQVPSAYPEEAWYHYDDQTCDYRCMAVEYFYWALTTLLGAQSPPQRCAEIQVEWELCTAESLALRDPAVHALLADPQYRLPTRLPDGQYRPSP